MVRSRIYNDRWPAVEIRTWLWIYLDLAVDPLIKNRTLANRLPDRSVPSGLLFHRAACGCDANSRFVSFYEVYYPSLIVPLFVTWLLFVKIFRGNLEVCASSIGTWTQMKRGKWKKKKGKRRKQVDYSIVRSYDRYSIFRNSCDKIRVKFNQSYIRVKNQRRIETRNEKEIGKSIRWNTFTWWKLSSGSIDVESIAACHVTSRCTSHSPMHLPCKTLPIHWRSIINAIFSNVTYTYILYMTHTVINMIIIITLVYVSLREFLTENI